MESNNLLTSFSCYFIIEPSTKTCGIINIAEQRGSLKNIAQYF
ncbi:predicted protein [Listeria monocytogenes J2818]|nr:predicted protein [Listeria monocytogenes J2818]